MVKKSFKRLGIFLFYDGAGKVSRHMKMSLKAFSAHVQDIVCVVNGKIGPDDEQELRAMGVNVRVRENSGYDVWGYRHGLFSVGFSSLKKYDEVLLFNYTFFAPLFDLGEMFAYFEARPEIDFWGITEYQDFNKRFLQSYFLCTRKRLHSSDEFYAYWNEMPEIKSVDDSIRLHEFRFSKYFETRGFKMAAYIPNKPSWDGNTTLVDVRGLIEARAPILKYRAFNFESDIIERRGGYKLRENFEFVRELTEYPIELIWEYIIDQTPVDKLIEHLELATIVDANDEAVGPNQVAQPQHYFFAHTNELAEAELLVSLLGGLGKNNIYVSSGESAVVNLLQERGIHVRRTDPMACASLGVYAWRSELASIITDKRGLVFNLGGFTGEKDIYRYRATLVQNYWEPLVGSGSSVAQIYKWFCEQKYIGVAFPPNNGVVGRQLYVNPLCTNASSWTFKNYPAPLQGAVGQAHWPWRGNCVMRSTLVMHPDFFSKLAQVYEAYDGSAGMKWAGPEAFLPEIARTLGWASSLVYSSKEVLKLALRAGVQERRLKLEFEKQLSRLKQQLSQIRTNPAAVPAEKAESVPASDGVPTDQVRPSTSSQSKSQLPITANTPPTTVCRQVPPDLSAAKRITVSSDKIVLHNVPVQDGKTRDIVLKPATFTAGRIDYVMRTADGIDVRGWCVERRATDKPVFVALVKDGAIVSSFTSNALKRAGLQARVKHQLQDEICGFSVTFRSTDSRNASVDLLLLDNKLARAQVVPVAKGKIGQ